MAIEKPLEPFTEEYMSDAFGAEDPDALEVEIEMPPGEAEEDGSIIVELEVDIDGELIEDVDHDANLADFIDEDVLSSMASELVTSFDADRMSRSDWAKAYVKGLDLLGMKIEERTQPWEGASGVFHPMLTEAVVRFQAQAMGELFPASGPVRTKIVGQLTPEKTEQAQRVQQELNYQLTEHMPEYREEMEQMLFRLPLAGSSFKKVYYDPLLERAVSAFVPAEDFVVSYGASDLQTCERYTHVMKKTPIEIMKLQAGGFYRDVELPEPTADLSDIQEKYDEMNGEEAVIDDDDRHTVLEMHVTMNMPEEYDDPDGIPRPYVVTIDKSSREILAIRRNWYDDDKRKLKRMHFVHYRYLPGMGFYGTGLIHMIGGLAKSATSIMRQLIDAGTLSNLPAGLKARGMRIKGDGTPLQPGEWRDVDVGGGTLRESLFPLPYKEPSAVLYQLLGNVVEEGRRIGSVADVQVGNMNPEAPVGTTLALLERSMKVMTGVQARLHASLKRELRLIASVIHDYMPAQYDYQIEGDFSRVDDFNRSVDVVPVSDPNAATMAQRVVQYQAALQLAQQAPQLYDLGKLHRQMLEVLGIQDADDIIKLPEDIKAKDPVTENMAILKQEPIKAFSYQDHEAHIAVHLAAAQDPKIMQLVGQSPFASAIQSALAAHITEHVAMQYRVEIQQQLGVEMPDPEDTLPEDVEREISRLTAAAAGKLLQKNQVAAATQAAQEAAQDPLTQIQRAELEIKQREVALKEAQATHDALMDIEKLKLDAEVRMANVEVQADRIKSEDRRAGANIGAKLATDIRKESSAEKQKGAEMGLKAAEAIIRDATKPQGGGQ
jgi:uncharacterized cupredoxin-like copper-binding protein